MGSWSCDGTQLSIRRVKRTTLAESEVIIGIHGGKEMQMMKFAVSPCIVSVTEVCSIYVDNFNR